MLLRKILSRASESVALLAVLGALVYSVCLLAFGCGESSVHRVARELYGPATKKISVNGVPLTCEQSEALQHATEFEKAVLAQRIEARESEDPLIYVLGHEYRAVVELEKLLEVWRKAQGCGLA